MVLLVLHGAVWAVSCLSIWMEGVWLEPFCVACEVLSCFCISMRRIAVASNDVYDNVISGVIKHCFNETLDDSQFCLIWRIHLFETFLYLLCL